MPLGNKPFENTGKRRNCSWRAISPLPTVFSSRLENFLLFSSNLKLSADYFNLEEFKICCWERVNPFANKPLFLHVCSTCLLETLSEKQKLLVMSNFSFYHQQFLIFQVFLTCLKNFLLFCPIWNCRLWTSVWRSLKFVIWERGKNIPSLILRRF